MSETKKHSVSAVDVASYAGKVDLGKSDHGDPTPKRLAAIQLAFDEHGVDNYITTIRYKGVEALVFKI